MPPLDPDHCYSAVQSRDRRFDGWFVTAVRTTGIYCRPSCPAVTPRRANVEFHHTAAAAQQRGFRACKRCRPDAVPGSPEWNVRQDVVGRAMRLIADGVVEREGVPGLAKQLGYSERHLNRVMTDELGAGPLAIARAHRVHTARQLIESTRMTFTDIAFAAGFGSVRQFNDTVRAVFASSPSELRSARSTRSDSPVGVPVADAIAAAVTLRLPTRAPFDGPGLLRFLAQRAIPGVESFDGERYRRTLTLPNGHGIVDVRAAADHVEAMVRLSAVNDLAVTVQRVRRLLDLDADPEAVLDHLGADELLGAIVRTAPGRRAPASVDAFETAVRAVIGQQVSVAGARTVAARMVEAVGATVAIADVAVDQPLTLRFPGPEELADAPDDAFAMPTARRDTIRSVAVGVAEGSIRLDAGADPEKARRELLAVKGVGPWTADYVLMRGLGVPDRFLPTDLGVVHALMALGADVRAHPDIGDRWAPWRSYAVHHLWGGPADVSTCVSPEPSAPSPPTTAGPRLHHLTDRKAIP